MAAAEPAKSAEEVKAARVEGGKKGGRGNRNLDSDTTKVSRGRGSDYLAARLKRDFPEIAAAVERGEKKDRRVTACFACVFRRMGSVHAFFDLHGEHASPHLVARHEAHAF